MSKYVLEENKIVKVEESMLQPVSKVALKEIIQEEIEKYGDKVDLNHIDTSNVKDMSYLFYDSTFNGNISKWNVSNVKNMNRMFAYSKFNGDISKWNVSNVTDMRGMFVGSKFSKNVSSWKINKVCDVENMFKNTPIENKRDFLPKLVNENIRDIPSSYKKTF